LVSKMITSALLRAMYNMIKLQNIKIAEVCESKTNPRGKNFEGPSFNDLIASIKEKGVLVPVIVRPTKGKYTFEIVAGNRRFRAAELVGLKDIPARVEEMNDTQACEVQIIENLQREDVHPIDEGEAYRKLKEVSKYEISAIAAKVGKNESYIKQRLFLTNLEQKVKDVYRTGKINDGHAVLIAKLSSGDQLAALKATIDRYNALNVQELKDWITKHIYSPMDFQPWLTSKELMEAAGKCVECKPEKMTLFGPIKEGACTDLKCWNRKMANYLNYIAKKEKRTKVSSDYGYSYGKKEAGSYGKILEKNDYVVVAAKGKGRCDSVHAAIVVSGSDVGQRIDICSNKECKIHGSSQSGYTLSPAEKARRKKEAEQAKKRAEEYAQKFQEAIQKIKFPLSEEQLDALFDFAFHRCGVSFQQPTAKFLKAEIVKKEEKSWDGKKKIMRTSYEATLRAWAEKNGSSGKLQIIFGLLMPHPSENYMDKFNKAVKKL